MAVAEIVNIVIEKGTDFEATFNIFNPDQSALVLTGLSTAYASIRKFPEATSYEEFSKTITAGTGTIQLGLTAEQTARLTAGRNYFDLVLTIGNKKIKFIKGTAIVEESVSL
jgi:LEA14-like dessication related protein